ncbi:MAG TPA: phospholipase C, phosphocholine-specific [Puia sp.]|nr:phospholipase C, phosphocholine-specific [Puia sp.]
MDTRRDFIRKAALLAGGGGLSGVLPMSIQRALAIDPRSGSTWLDAEHIVILMQENRSFDHCFGALRGVRGFRDPRAISLPDKNPVWLQTNEAGETYAPFRLDIKGTNATWMGSLPHSWTNQLDARNDGRYDKWLQSKHSSHKDYAGMPLTMGYYDRRDLPFYYALADAFTTCDQTFCSTLTGTTPNRLHLWAGTIRDEQKAEIRPRVRNQDTDYYVPAAYPTFPERLEDHGISWKIYQNELSLDTGLKGEEDAWLANFGDNPIEWFSQYNVRFSHAYIRYLPKKIALLAEEVAALEKRSDALPAAGKEGEDLRKKLQQQKEFLQILRQEQEKYTPENYEKLTQREKNLHEKAFITNRNDPAYHELTNYSYRDGEQERQMNIPKGDVLHQFREDVKKGALPTVSWLVPPEAFSDHPSSAWYGAWYISEVMDILTEDPEVWKKTIFILCYDENDGYFDHVPPFVSPHPDKPETGFASKGIDTGLEHMSREQDLQREEEPEARGGPLGLGFRVPLLIASPWSRGGYINSQVFDHTSILQLLEVFLSQKSGKKIEETNINNWRRTVCGDLSSVFRPFQGEKINLPFHPRLEFLGEVHNAKFKQLPSGYKQLTREEIGQFRQDPFSSPLMPVQEKGVRPACALPYELKVEGRLKDDKRSFAITMRAGNEWHGKRSAGAPFTVYSHGAVFSVRNYAVAAGDQLTDHFPLDESGNYDLRVYGPNGFFRAFTGGKKDPPVLTMLEYEEGKDRKPTGRVQVKLVNADTGRSYTIHIKDNAYKGPGHVKVLGPAGLAGNAFTVAIDPGVGKGWYDLSVLVEGAGNFAQRYAGRVETGREGISDPAMA